MDTENRTKKKVLKAVILAAGRSTRTYPLTLTRPKPLLPVANRPIIMHNLEALSGLVDGVVIVVGFRKEMIKEALGHSFAGLKISYAEQDEQLGTGHAALQAEKSAGERFILMMGDDLYSPHDLRELSQKKNAALVQERDGVSSYGVYLTKIEGGKEVPAGFVEKPRDLKRGLCNTGSYVFTKGLFSLLRGLKKSPRGELELTDAVSELISRGGFELVKARDYWLPVTYPWSLLEANSHFLKGIKGENRGTLEPGVTIKGEVIIGEGTVVRSGTCIEGPVAIGKNCVIGPHAYIRPDTAIADNCKIRAEVFDAVVMDGCAAKHTSYIAHSVLGQDVNIGAGTVTADYRHDGMSNWTVVNGKKVDTGRRKLGSFMGDHVRTGINTSIYPGRKLWPGVGTLPGEVVTRDITEPDLKTRLGAGQERQKN